MIKFTAQGKGVTLYGFGLSRGNIDRLTAGQPIKVDLRDMGGPPIAIALFFGETEQAIFDELKATGAIGPDVVYRAAEPGVAEVTRIKRTHHENTP